MDTVYEELRKLHLTRQARDEARKQVEGHEPVSSELARGVDYVFPGVKRDPRGAMYGYNRSVSGRLHPRLSHADLDAMMAGTDEVHYSELLSILSKLFKPGSDEWKDYLSTRIAQRKALDDGTGEYSVVRNVFPPFLPPGLDKEKFTAKVKKYELVQFFRDSYVTEKYDLSSKFITSMQLLAINDPLSAAKTIEEKVQALSPQVQVRVTAGRYSESRAQCQRTIKKKAAGIPDRQGASDALLVANKLFVYEPNKPVGEGWHVYGPLQYAESIYDIYRMVMKAGCKEVGVLFPFELVKLDIYIHDGQGIVSSTFIGNVGLSSTLQFVALRHSLLDKVIFSELEARAANCLPVMSGGSAVATALRMSEGIVVVNAHVVENMECYVDGVKLIGGFPMGQDLWAYDIGGKAVSWKLRTPRVGERAVLMAHTVDDVSVSSEFRVDKVDGSNVYSRRIPEVAEGASGAALMSLEDGALLGVHGGLCGSYMLAVSISSGAMGDMQEWASDLRKGYEQREEVSTEVVSQLERRGAKKTFVSVLSSLLPVYDVNGAHVGTAINMGDKVLTTLPPSSYLVGEQRREVRFEHLSGQYSSTDSAPFGADRFPMVTRLPDAFESVVVVGADSTSTYVTRVTTVRQVAQGKRTFMLASTEGNIYPLSGGVVVSMQDAAVLGSFVRESTSVDVGRLSLCTTVVPSDVESVADPASLLRDKFPKLNLSVWPSGVVEEVFSHPSLQLDKDCRNLARIGDAAIRAALHVELRAIGYDGNQSDLIAKYQSNAALAEVCWSCGIASALKKQQGLSFPASSKAYADLLEALMGAIYMHESYDTFKAMCLALNIVPTLDASPRLLRRGSSFDGLTVPFGALDSTGESLVTPVD